MTDITTRPQDDQNTEGPRGTYGCACRSRDSAECHLRRYGIVAGDASHGAEECGCLCHHDPDGWPAVQMRDISTLLAEVEALRTRAEAAERALNWRTFPEEVPEEAPEVGAECMLRVRYGGERPTYTVIDTWVALGVGWSDHCDSDVIAWIPVPPDDAMKDQAWQARAALAAPKAEPVAYMWQHEDTGRTGFAERMEVEAGGFDVNNPRLKIVGPLYAAPPAPDAQEASKP